MKNRILALLLVVYAFASLVHFIHNAEFLADYPNMPATWSRGDVYAAWLVITAVGIAGWLLVVRGFRTIGLCVLALYAAFGLDSLGHYFLAPMSSHTVAMNGTILFEVTAAMLVLIEVARRFYAELQT
jgi:hypothetical protein